MTKSGVDMQAININDPERYQEVLGRFISSIDSSKYSLAREGMPPDPYQHLMIHVKSLEADIWAYFALVLLSVKGHPVDPSHFPSLRAQMQRSLDDLVKMADSVKVEKYSEH